MGGDGSWGGALRQKNAGVMVVVGTSVQSRRNSLHVVEIEERFLSAQADAFTGSEREEEASAHSGRNDRFSWMRSHDESQRRLRSPRPDDFTSH